MEAQVENNEKKKQANKQLNKEKKRKKTHMCRIESLKN